MTTHDTGVVQAVLDAVATHEGIDETQLNPPLYDVINADALNALYDNGATPTVQFEYRDYSIVVKGPEDVYILYNPNNVSSD